MPTGSTVGESCKAAQPAEPFGAGSRVKNYCCTHPPKRGADRKCKYLPKDTHGHRGVISNAQRTQKCNEAASPCVKEVRRTEPAGWLDLAWAKPQAPASFGHFNCRLNGLDPARQSTGYQRGGAVSHYQTAAVFEKFRFDQTG
ncbi:hypothetical protein AAHC03_016378 [Spirometra sp. Aus1]